MRIDTRHVDDDFAQRVALHRFGGHVFGGMDGLADGTFGRIEIDHRASLDSLGGLITHAQNLDSPFVIDNPADKTGNLVAANIQRGQNRAFGFQFVFH